LPEVAFLEAIAQAPVAVRILVATKSPSGETVTDPEVVAAVEATATLLEGLGHAVQNGAPSIDADAVADSIAVLHTVSNAQLHAFAAAHLGRAPREDEFDPSTWVMIREGFTTSCCWVVWITFEPNAGSGARGAKTVTLPRRSRPQR
jgi:amidase